MAAGSGFGIGGHARRRRSRRRRWIGADINKGAIQTTEKRLASIIEGQAAYADEQLTMEDGGAPRAGPALADIPGRKEDLVAGEYLVKRPSGKSDRPVAVRITDMLGEEVLVVEGR